MSGYQKSEINRSAKLFTQNNLQVWGRAEECNCRLRNNLWGLASFVLISIIAFSCKEFNLFESASEPVRQILGTPPPALFINIALVVYCVSAFILTLTSIASDSVPAPAWKNLGYRSAFYLFYSFSGAISGHFIPVLLVGLFLYALDQCHIWVYNSKAVQERNELLKRF